MRARVLALLPLLLIPVIATVACGSGGDAPTAGLNLPETWSRVQVREGMVGRHAENPLVGFTIDLPPGWSAGEAWPYPEILAGWIAAPRAVSTLRQPMLQWSIGGKFRRSLPDLEQDPRYQVTQTQVEGVDTILHLAAPGAGDEGPIVGVFYERIPGAPDGIAPASLRIEGSSRGFTDQQLLARVLMSVRYSELPSLPGLPATGPGAGPDWARTDPRSDFSTFTLRLPPGWTATASMGYDTLIGTLAGDGITLYYDFGTFAGAPFGSGDRELIAGERPAHRFWEERIEDTTFSFIRPVSSDPSPDALTGVFFSELPGDPDPSVHSRLSIRARDLDGAQQDTVLAIFRTIRHPAFAPSPSAPAGL